ncbi:MAG: hypothetical protein DLM53_11370 [Candidatus Eremiobacter antarcticus]|nr:hypothetical protein [Candidatus Eremiobacteraeota bacterium]PZR60267.1 MAG: hypothetical protein DLM53_11370 [Candidatus Eremiobacter sp. RRmetagenome_bin22]
MKSFLGVTFACACAFWLALGGLRVSADMPTLAGLEYRSIGPAIAVGRTTAVAGADSDQQFYLAGGADGGVFKSADGGSSWVPIFDKATTAAIGAIAVAPHNARDIWIGTGEANPRNDVAQGDGIWHSTDGGKTWKHAGLRDAGSISSISIDPRDSRRVVVGVLGQIFRDNPMRGIYVTADSGVTWKRALYVGPMTGASDMTRVPGHPDTLFAGLYEIRRKPWELISGGYSGGIYRSNDAGNTWRKLRGNGLPRSPTGRIGVAAGSRARIYALIESKSGDLWRSDDGGDRWRLMPHSPLVGSRPFYFSRIFVDPANPDSLISNGLWLSMSTNGGRSFHLIGSNAGWDYHEVWWSADGRRLGVGSDEGVTMSSDGGATWRQPYDLPFSQAYHLGFDDARPNYHVCIGLQDDRSWCGAANSDTGLGVLNRDWRTVGGGDSMWALYDPLDTHLVWSTSTSNGTGEVYLWDSRTQQALEVSPDAAINWGVAVSGLKHRFNWDSPITFKANGKALVGGEVVYESADHGQHWSIISPDLTRNERSHQQMRGGPVSLDVSGAETSDTILSLAVSPLDGDVLWAGSDDGLVHVTRDSGKSWSRVTLHGAPSWGRVSTIETGRFKAGGAFVAIDNHMLGDERPYLFATSDYGATWRSISGDLPRDLFVRVVRQDPVNGNLLYAGTQRGVWASWDGGSHWRSLRLNMPASAIYDIEIQPRANDLLVATHGRGVWVFDDLEALQKLGATTTTTVTLFAPRTTYRWWQWAPINYFKDSSLPSNIFRGPNVEYGALITYALAPGKHRKGNVEIVDSQGHAVRHLSGKHVPLKTGFNRIAWDLNEDGPPKWVGTFEDNRGTETGAEAMPGTYTVRLNVDGITREQQVTVVADPRDPSSESQMRQRHDTLHELNSELGSVNVMLNQLDKRLSVQRSGEGRSRLLAFRRRLTYDPKNVEDFGGTVGLRERLQDLILRISGSSLQSPTQVQADMAASYRQAVKTTEQAFSSLSF